MNLILLFSSLVRDPVVRLFVSVRFIDSPFDLDPREIARVCAGSAAKTMAGVRIVCSPVKSVN
jgi:hypothetical protein